MPTPAIVAVSITVLGSVVFIAFQLRQSLRERRNLKHWEKGEPFKSVTDWD